MRGAKKIHELNINFCECDGKGDAFITVTSSVRKWTNKIRKLSESDPHCEIKYENPDGSIVAVLPVKYLKLSKPPLRNMSDEQRKAVAERLRKARMK